MSLEEQLIQSGRLTPADSSKGKLLRAAAHLFRQQGYERTTVRDLAKAVGIQSGSLFHHFKTKEDILSAVMAETIIISTARLQDAIANLDDPKERLLALITSELRSILGETGEAMAVLVHEWRSLSEAKRQNLLKLRNRYEDVWNAVLDEANAAGLLQVEPLVLRRLLTGALAWVIFWYKPDGPLTQNALAEAAFKLAVSPNTAPPMAPQVHI